MRTLFAAVAVIGVLAALPASAANAPPKRFLGTIGTYDAATHALSVKTFDGKTISVAMAPDARVIANEKKTIADIKPGDFVASAGAKGADGKIHAKEVRIFPEALRGLGEGQYDWTEPNTSMTNATVQHVQGAGVATKSGTLMLTFHGSTKSADGVCSGHATGPGKGVCVGQTEIVVGPKVPVTSWVLGDASWLVPGKVVSVFASAGPDGKLTTHGVVVERNGIKPTL